LGRCLIGTWKGVNETVTGQVFGQPVHLSLENQER